MNVIDTKNRSQAELQLELVESKTKRLELANNQIVQMARGTRGNKYIAETDHFLDELVAAKHMFQEAFRSLKKEEKSDTPNNGNHHICVT